VNPANGTLVGLMRAFNLRSGGAPVELPHSAQRLLAFLALHDRPLLRPYVAGCLWTDAPERRAAASLRSALWRLREPGVIHATATHLRLADGVRVDLNTAAASARRVLDGEFEPADVHALTAAGDVLPDWYDDWVLLERERFRQVRLLALEVLSRRLAEAGRMGEAIDAAILAVTIEPLRESAHRAVIVLHLQEGNVGEAIRQFETYRKLLARDLGLEPSPDLAKLIRQPKLTMPRLSTRVAYG
jgi:DNA-binding SARP family transcriptional activator